MFDSLSERDARGVALLKRAALVFVACCAATALLSGYRAWVQVRGLELSVDDAALRGGSVVRTSVVCSGRTTVDVRLELIQGARAETLALQRVPGNEWAAIDPRPRAASQAFAVSPETLARFQAGAALLRATATGRPQLTRLPPPTVRETPVEIRRE